MATERNFEVTAKNFYVNKMSVSSKLFPEKQILFLLLAVK